VSIIYCIDTSSLIEIYKNYPFDLFPSVWKKITSLIKESRLMSPVEVESEIRDDELIRWLKPNRDRLFTKIDHNQAIVVSEILREFPNLVEAEKTTPEADPFVVALALAKTREEQESMLTTLGEQNEYIVVCEEAPTGRGYKHKIPYVCSYYGLECIRMIDLFRRENWKF